MTLEAPGVLRAAALARPTFAAARAFAAALALATLALVGAGGTIATCADAAPAARTLDACDAEQRAHPAEFAPYQCYWSVSRQRGQSEDVARRLEALLAIEQRNDKARLYLGVIYCDRGDERGPPLVRQALRGFERDGDLRGQVYGQTTLLFWYNARRGANTSPDTVGPARGATLDETADAAREAARRAALDASRDAALDAALDAARRSGAFDLILMAEVQQGWRHLHDEDYGRAYVTFRRLADRLGASPLTRDNWQALDGLAAAAAQMQFTDESLAAYRRVDEYLARIGSRFERALLHDNMIEVARAAGIAREVWEPWARAALADAQATNNTPALARAHRHVGGLGSDAERRRHLEAAIGYSREANRLNDLALALAELGGHRVSQASRVSRAPQAPRVAPAERELVAGLALLDEAVDTARRSADRWLRLAVRQRRASALWVAGRHAPARAEYDRLFEELDQWRALQAEPSVRARVFSPFCLLYKSWPALLLRDAHDDRSAVHEAFAALERLRGRELVDELDEHPGDEPAPRDPLERQRQEIVHLIATTQTRLLDTTSSPAERAAALAELERLELGEIEVRGEIARREPARGSAVDGATLDDVMRHLAPDQAIFYFVWFPRPASDHINAVLLVTSSDVRVFRLPDAPQVDSALRGLPGLAARRDGSEADAAAWLGRELLAAVLPELPSGVDQLVIVPDGALYLLPFELLRTDAGGEPLGQRFALTIAPSATAWLAAQAREAPRSRGVLALADPVLPASGQRLALSRDWSRLGVNGLGALPHARREAQGVGEAMGNTVLRVGEEATERFVKDADLSRFGLVHFAAHALVDTDRPERSALLLAPGAGGEDGLLQPREIVRLDWRGRVIVLSGCRSATGELVAGEGPVGLAHAFLRGGARAVIGSVWPVRDDEAEAFIAAFYEGLARGDSLGTALRDARQRLRAAGAPAAAWSGFVVIGDGAWVPLPGGIAARGTPGAPVVVTVTAAVAAALILLGATWKKHQRAAARSTAAR